MLHLFALLVALSTALLIFAGGLVTSTGSGLSVPDWPNTYGWFMFSFPLDKMVGGIRYEHSHRLIASTVGLLMIVLAFWLWRTERRQWVRRLGYLALAAVITQGILGGITVLWFLPDPISIAHASLAQIVFCLTSAIALFTSPGWKRAYADHEPRRRGDADVSEVQAPRLSDSAFRGADDRRLQRFAAITTGWIYLQIVIGATMRHTDAGLAIPDFPLAFGRLIPPMWDAGIAIHFAHRVGALVAAVLIAITAVRVFRHHRRRSELVRPSLLLLVLLVAQITLGALTVLTGKHYVINSLHVVTGASVLATSLVLALRAHRARFVDSAAPATSGVGVRAARPVVGSRPSGARA
jgi:cytochrome c oxidase assembly protein subunit 15